MRLAATVRRGAVFRYAGSSFCSALMDTLLALVSHRMANARLYYYLRVSPTFSFILLFVGVWAGRDKAGGRSVGGMGTS
jgi:hypothetical protein